MIALLAALDVENESMYTREGDGIEIAEMRTVFIYIKTIVFCTLCVVCFTARRTGNNGQVSSERKRQSVFCKYGANNCTT